MLKRKQNVYDFKNKFTKFDIIFQTMMSSPDDSVSIDLLSLDKGNKKEMFDAAIHSVKSQL